MASHGNMWIEAFPEQINKEELVTDYLPRDVSVPYLRQLTNPSLGSPPSLRMDNRTTSPLSPQTMYKGLALTSD